jgi:hypothetical protein
MFNRLTPLLLLSAAIVFACGPRPHSATKTTATTHKKKASSAMTLTPSLDVKVGNAVEFAFRVTNESDKRVELMFPSGQTHDIAVLDESGREVWRWSSERMFTQSIQNKLVSARDSISFSERWSPAGMHGKFTAVASLNSQAYPLEHRAEFELP